MKHRLLQFLAGTLGPVWLRLNVKSLRTQVLGREAVDRMMASRGSVIYAVWHSRFWLPSVLFAYEGSALLVSLSKDGDLIAAVATRLGYQTVRGSSSRGGSDALQALEARLRAGQNVAVTPDGPRGPREVAKVGAVLLSRRSGKPIVPVGACAHPARHFDSWDRFQMPHWFGRGCVVFGEAYEPEPGLSVEAGAEELGRRLSACQAQAEQAVRP